MRRQASVLVCKVKQGEKLFEHAFAGAFERVFFSGNNSLRSKSIKWDQALAFFLLLFFGDEKKVRILNIIINIPIEIVIN